MSDYRNRQKRELMFHESIINGTMEIIDLLVTAEHLIRRLWP